MTIFSNQAYLDASTQVSRPNGGSPKAAGPVSTRLNPRGIKSLFRLLSLGSVSGGSTAGALNKQISFRREPKDKRHKGLSAIKHPVPYLKPTLERAPKEMPFRRVKIIRFAFHEFHVLSWTPLPGYFSVFLYSTCPLSVYH